MFCWHLPALLGKAAVLIMEEFAVVNAVMAALCQLNALPITHIAIVPNK
jgi:hypothetical protein